MSYQLKRLALDMPTQCDGKLFEDDNDAYCRQHPVYGR